MTLDPAGRSPDCSTVRNDSVSWPRRCEGIAPNVLTTRLRQLERDGLVVATPYSQRPVRLAYALTDSGRELGDAIALLSAWGAHQTGDTEGPTHARAARLSKPASTARRASDRPKTALPSR